MTGRPSASQPTLTHAQVARVFPFHFVVDRELRVVAIGPSLARICPQLLGAPLSETFASRGHQLVSFDDVVAAQESAYVLAARDTDLLLRGQFILQAPGHHLLFVGSPWLTDLSSMTQLGIKPSDFGVQDPVADIVQLLEMRVAAEKEAQQSGMQLKEKQAELERTLSWLTLQYAVSDALQSPDSKADVVVRFISLICQATEWQTGVVWLLEGECLRPLAAWQNPDLDAALPDEDARIAKGEGLVGGVCVSGVATTERGASELQQCFARPIHGTGERTFGVLALSNPRQLPGTTSEFAIFEATIKLGAFLERDRSREELIAAKEQAEAGTRVKDEFLANMSHELRTPLNGVLGTAQLLASCDLPSHARRYVETLIRSGNNLLVIINDLLDLAKIEAGKLDLELGSMDPLPLVEEVFEQFYGTARPKDLALLIDCQARVSAYGDPLRLRQVLLNLVGNALKFTQKGFVRVVLKLDTQHPGFLRCEVHDSGIGISQERIAQLFVPFEQAGSAVTRRYGGTGLGLAICKRLMGMMGGDIGVSSLEGVGSVFWFRMPLSAAEPTAPTVERPALLWVVHPDEAVRQALTSNLTLAGHRVVAWMDTETLRGGAAGSSEAERPAYCIADAQYAEQPELRTWLEGVCPRIIWFAAGDAPDSLAGASVLQTLITPSRLTAALAPALGSSAAGRTQPQVAQAVEPQAPAEAPAGSARVLLVDDNSVNQLVASAMLKQLGYTVEVASSGRACLDRLAAASFDIVLMDCHMPELDGFDTTRLIRNSTGPTSRVPVIALTAAARVEDHEQCIDAGMDDFLSKPVQREALHAMIERWVARAAPNRSASQSA